MSLGICLFVVDGVAAWPSFCENSETSVRACELSPCFCFASVLSHSRGKKKKKKQLEALKERVAWVSWGLRTPRLRGCGSSHRLHSGNVSTREEHDGRDGDVCIHGFQSEVY